MISISKFSKKLWLNRYVLILVIICIIFSITNYYVIKKDQVFFTHDSHTYYWQSIQLNPNAKLLKLYSQTEEITENKSRYYNTLLFAKGKGVPLILLSSFFYQLGEYSEDVALLTNLAFLPILIFSVFGIGKIIASKKVGFLAAIIVILYPGIYGTSRVFLPIFGLTALIALDILLLLKTEGFTNIKYSIALGLTLILTTLMKPTTVLLYLACPFIAIIYHNFKKKNPIRPRHIVNSLIILLSFIGTFILFFSSPESTVYFLSRRDILTENIISLTHNQNFISLVISQTYSAFEASLSPILLWIAFFSVVYFLFIKRKKSPFLLWMDNHSILYADSIQQRIYIQYYRAVASTPSRICLDECCLADEF